MRKSARGVIYLILILLTLYLGLVISNFGDLQDHRAWTFLQWATGDDAERAPLVTVQRDACPGAPFVLPTDGFIGLLYADPNGPYSPSSPHQGIDIFSNAEPGIMPVYAAYDGYIHRESSWRSALIQRVPEDPLQSGRQIWLYYAHMADRDGNSFIEAAFPAGTEDVYVERGTLLGYTGDYNGGSLRDIWVHLHFSIVLDDGSGRYANELEFSNTLDPTPYLGLPVNYDCRSEAMGCQANLSCGSN